MSWVNGLSSLLGGVENKDLDVSESNHKGSYGGHSGYGSHSGYGGHSGHGGGGYKLQCCPLVVDPLTFTALLGAIAAGTFFLNMLITMNIMMRRRRKRNQEQPHLLDSLLEDVIHSGNHLLIWHDPTSPDIGGFVTGFGQSADSIWVSCFFAKL